ncbi:MAG: tetratricopeptide repeat protein [Proteobacteria bacterium]|nr:tetratricopeptide repeat protein [Pseudomonadota bacterium]
MKRSLFLFGLLLLFTGFGDGDAINNSRGNGYFNKGHYKQAAKLYGKIKNKRNKFIAEYNRGNASIKSGDLQNGLGLLGDVAENGKSDIASKAYYNMGSALFNNQKYKEAANMYINALKLKPDFNDAKYNLEKTLRLLKQKKQNNENKQKNKNNSQKNKQKKNNKKSKNNKKQNKQNRKQNINQRENGNRQKMSKKEAERILNALMRNRKRIKKDSTAFRKFLSPRYTW